MQTSSMLHPELFRVHLTPSCSNHFCSSSRERKLSRKKSHGQSGHDGVPLRYMLRNNSLLRNGYGERKRSNGTTSRVFSRITMSRLLVDNQGRLILVGNLPTRMMSSGLIEIITLLGLSFGATTFLSGKTGSELVLN